MVKNIIFDLGGVLLNLDMMKTQKAFMELGMTDFELHYTQAKQSGLFDSFDKGAISPAEFRMGLRKNLPREVMDAQIDLAWNAMLLDLPKERLELLKDLKKNYRLFLLSNTNEIHVQSFSSYLQKTFGFSDFSEFFETPYYSCNIGMRKPDREIFDFVLNNHSLKAEETVFIDDSPQHVIGAESTGIHAILLHQNETIMDLFKEHKLIPFLKS